jgi:hypothetical protein
MRPPLVLLVWAVLLGVLACLQLAFRLDTMTFALAGGGAVFVAAVGTTFLLAGRVATRSPAQPRSVPDLSLATVVCAIGGCSVLIGAEVGLWLILIGAGVLVLGLAGLAREVRAQRRADPGVPR